MSASLTSSAIFSAAGRKLDMVAECNLFHLILYFQGDISKYLINLSLLVQSVLELEPEIDSAGGFQNLPWNYVEVVFLNALFQQTIMFSVLTRYFQFLPILSFSLLCSYVLIGQEIYSLISKRLLCTSADGGDEPATSTPRKNRKRFPVFLSRRRGPTTSTPRTEQLYFFYQT